MDGIGGVRASALVRNAARRLQFAATTVEAIADDVAAVATLIGEALAAGGKILVCGNGGSAACAQHFAAEFTGKLKIDRAPYPAISLTTDTSALTAIANDYGYDEVFSRQVEALARPGDVVVGLSTSGSSRNVVKAFEAARAAGAHTVGLTGADDALGADHSLKVSLRETARIQEAHDLILHELAQVAERILVPHLAFDASSCPFEFVLEERELADFREWIAQTGQRLVTTNGVYDLFHAGHAASLTAARAQGDRLVVLVNDDASVRRLKGERRPIRGEADRMGDIARLPAVDHVVLMTGDDPRSLLAVLKPDVHAKGRDYEGRGLIEAGTVEQGGGEIVYLDLVPGVSTTGLVERASS